MFDAIRIRLVYRERPLSRPRHRAEDIRYSVTTGLALLECRNIRGMVAEPSNQRAPCAHHAGSKLRFGRVGYRQRHGTGNCEGWLKDVNRITSRYEKLALSYRALRKLAIAGCRLECVITHISRGA
jgi:transposase